MKCFTVYNLTLWESIPLQERESKKTGNSFFAVHVGEYGTGRKLTWVACHPSLEIDENQPFIIRAGVGKTKAGNYVIIPEKDTNDNRALIRVYGEEGYRGGLGYSFSEGVTTLAQGTHAQGAAGRMGGGDEFLVIMELGSSIDITRYGRLYGSNKKVRIQWDGDELQVFDPESEPEECDFQVVEVM